MADRPTESPFEALFRQTAANEPVEFRGQYLSVPGADTPYLTGTTLPALVRRATQRPSGLLVIGETRSRIDELVKAYLTPGEIDIDLVPGQVLHLIGAHPLESVVASCALLMADLYEDVPSSQETQLRLVEKFCTGTTRRLAESAVRDGRVFLAPQLVLCVAKLAFMRPDSVMVRTEDQALADVLVAALGLADYLGRDFEREEDPEPGVMPEHTVLDVIRNQAFYDVPPVAVTLGRYIRLRELGAERDPETSERFDQVFAEATGVGVDTLFEVGFTAWMTMASGHTVRLSRGQFDQLQRPAAEVDRALDLLSADEATLETLLAGELQQFGFSWSANTFRRYPMLRCDDGTFLVVHSRFLLERACGTAAFWETRNALTERSQRGSTSARRKAKKERGAFETFSGLVPEDYVAEAFTGLVGTDDDLTNRVWREEELQAHWPGEKCCDLLVDGGHAWLPVEVVSHRLSEPASTNGPRESIERDLEFIVDVKATQLDALIRRMIAIDNTLPGLAARSDSVRFHPVVVATSGFPWSPVMARIVHERLRAKDLLQGDRIAPLTVITMSELEQIEAFVEQGRIGLVDLFARREEDGDWDMPVANWLYQQLGLLQRPERLTRASDRGFASLAAAHGLPWDERHDVPDAAA